MQNTLQQLDLFGMPISVQPEPKKKEKLVKVSVIPPQPETPVIAPVATVVEELPPVKIKAAKPAVVKASSQGKRGRKSFKEMDSEIGLIEIPEEDVLKQKLYYSISEVASWFKVNTSLLRYWENEFDVLQPRKTRKGDRLFRLEDIRNLQLIYHLLRQRKFSIDGAKNYLKNQKQKADAQFQLMETLTRFKSFLLELKASL